MSSITVLKSSAIENARYRDKNQGELDGADAQDDAEDDGQDGECEMHQHIDLSAQRVPQAAKGIAESRDKLRPRACLSLLGVAPYSSCLHPVEDSQCHLAHHRFLYAHHCLVTGLGLVIVSHQVQDAVRQQVQ